MLVGALRIFVVEYLIFDVSAATAVIYGHARVGYIVPRRGVVLLPCSAACNGREYRQQALHKVIYCQLQNKVGLLYQQTRLKFHQNHQLKCFTQKDLKYIVRIVLNLFLLLEQGIKPFLESFQV